MGDVNASAEISLKIDESVATLSLNRPDKLNRLSAQMQRDLSDGLSRAEAHGCKVAVIRGSGRAFSTGYDLDPGSPGRKSYMDQRDIENDRSGLARTSELWRTVRAHPTPILTEIDGYCLAGGTDLMLASDIAIASLNAQIGMPNTRSLGITMMLPVWVWMVGPMRAKLLAFTGDTLTGEQAAKWGLVTIAVPQQSLRDTVDRLAARIAMLPRDMLVATKRALNQTHEAAGLAQAMAGTVEIDAIAHCSETVRAFWEEAGTAGLKQSLETRDKPFRGESVFDIVDEARGIY